MVHPVVQRVRNLGADMRDAGKVHDRIHVGDQRRPVDRACKVALRHDLNTCGKVQSAPLARRRAHRVSGLGKRNRQRTADESRRAGHQNAGHRLPRWKVISSQATSAPPIASTAMSTVMSGSIALTSASTPSATFSVNTRATISVTENPPSVAR